MSELGSDPLDIASDREMEFREAAIAAVRANLVESHPDFDGKTCLECAADIPEARLALQRIRCVHCQELLDSRSKLYRR